MKKYFFLAGIMFCVLAYATENWTWQYKPLAATYSIYSGELGERQPPTKNERKLAIAIKGVPQKRFSIHYILTPRMRHVRPKMASGYVEKAKSGALIGQVMAINVSSVLTCVPAKA